MKPSDKIHLRSNLVSVIENDTVFIVPKKHWDIWDRKHSFAVKRAASVIVIVGNTVEKNLFGVA